MTLYDASHIISNGEDQSKATRIGANINAYFNLSKYQDAIFIEEKGWSLESKLYRCIETLLKYNPTCSRKDLTSCMYVGDASLTIIFILD